jgi:hypothetical protein
MSVRSAGAQLPAPAQNVRLESQVTGTAWGVQEKNAHKKPQGCEAVRQIGLWPYDLGLAGKRSAPKERHMDERRWTRIPFTSRKETKSEGRRIGTQMSTVVEGKAKERASRFG